MKPIIGIVEWPYLDKDEDLIYEILNPIVEWVILSGGRPIGIFPSQIEDFVNKRIRELREMSEIEQIELKESIDMCDGIIKPGALKIYPHERKIYEYCYKEDKPYLGICAGMQIMASYDKGMIENVKNDSDLIHHTKDIYSHEVEILDNTKLKELLNKTKILVNSRHNYHIKDSGFQTVSALSPDGYIEAIEAKDKIYNLGFQWHPELLPKDDQNSQIIFGKFVEASKTYRKRMK